jgi:hypothetical protein
MLPRPNRRSARPSEANGSWAGALRATPQTSACPPTHTYTTPPARTLASLWARPRNDSPARGASTRNNLAKTPKGGRAGRQIPDEDGRPRQEEP